MTDRGRRRQAKSSRTMPANHKTQQPARFETSPHFSRSRKCFRVGNSLSLVSLFKTRHIGLTH